MAAAFLAVRSVVARPSSSDLIFAVGLGVWYFLCALIGGLIYGLSFPVRTTRFRSLVCAAVAAFIPYTILALAIYLLGNPFQLSLARHIVAAVLASLVSGGLFGWFEWTYRDDKPTLDAQAPRV